MKWWIVASLFAIAAVFVAWKNYSFTHGNYELIIGILSSRNHFDNRRVIRNGLKDSLSPNVLLKFIVSKNACNIPPEDRVDEFRCEASHSSHKKIDYEMHTTYYLQNIPTDFQLINAGDYGLDFQVNHPIVIHELGVYDHAQDGIKGMLKVVLYNYGNKDVVTKAVFTSFSTGEKDGFYLYKPAKRFVLPKGFYGSLVVQGVSNDDPVLGNADCIVNSGGGLITHKMFYRSLSATDSYFPGFQNKYFNSSCFIAGPSFRYSSYENSDNGESDFQRMQRHKYYSNQIEEQEKRLQKEYLEYNDIFFADVVESYRMLPMKMLHFYSWLSVKEFSFFLKSDDDCFINVTAILQMLKYTLRNGKNNIVFGSFRLNFALDQHGKWAEHDFISLTYPPFPCGSGYLLSKDIVDWIFYNKFRLKIYQGEDVSLGIWLSAINVNLINDNRFRCTRNGHDGDSFTSPDHTLEDLIYHFGPNKNIF
ncbi:UDP-GalNAc:beta-1,3-N-acetylgalactosaminyltransferase 2 [Hydra vulgaris]|uniref:UDP-GalNAc:beta-1, 3-N-acetylgalactosaminyltransferase 2 n=1 Tax=Hydra vulgaris TaxID=6087 RepID=UPI001F5FF191|nr:UDP-GalNAc:beta-1,3-N-acetylgalactosaminyltransferase 2 [Hydra vulgaris]